MLSIRTVTNSSTILYIRQKKQVAYLFVYNKIVTTKNNCNVAYKKPSRYVSDICSVTYKSKSRRIVAVLFTQEN